MTDLTRITQDMIALYDRFTHEGSMSRRDMMAGMTRLAGSAAAAAAIVPLIEASAQAAAPAGTENNQILAQRVVYSDGVNDRMVGWLARPERGQKRYWQRFQWRPNHRPGLAGSPAPMCGVVGEGYRSYDRYPNPRPVHGPG